ncbi:MAG: polysaccharide export protein [Opitutales bacterium]|nr:polysaccharide export protein [Opitutales bacterium]
MKTFRFFCALLCLGGCFAADLWSETSVRPGEMSNYLLRPSDLIQIQVFQEPDLNKEVRIEANGTIVLPLINRVKVGGISISEAQERIRYLYDKDYLVNPQVSVLVLEYKPREVDVLGQVNAPGPVEIPFDRELTLVEAISRAKGFTRLARRSSVQVTRINEDGEKEVFTINADKMMGEVDSKEYILKEGDSVYVPERLL